jgi:hypothetical protein
VQEETLPSVPEAIVTPPFSVSIYSFPVAAPGASPAAGS